MEELGELIKENKVLIFTKSDCEDTEYVQHIFESLDVSFRTIFLDENREELENAIFLRTTKKLLPTVFVNGWELSGRRVIGRYYEDGTLQKMVDGSYGAYDYDLLVIGGGSGGIAAAREASRLGVLVCLCDFVTPSPQGATWGLGGTCVNVGCVPKKLMHMAANIGADMEDGSDYGWEFKSKPHHNWTTLITELQNHVKSLNFGYRKSLRQLGVVYMNALAEFVDAHTVRTVDKHNEEKTIKAREYVIATGGRPVYMDIPGAEYAITSDDIFSLTYHPGKVLVVGASYVALECAGFLHCYGADTTVCARQKVLRRYDQQMAEMVVTHMSGLGVRFMRDTVVEKIAEVKSGQPGTCEVTFKAKDDKVLKKQFNTVLFAIGRKPCTEGLGLDKAGVNVNPSTGYILVNERDETSAPHVYALGDVCEGRAQLTPVAVQTGKLLSRRLFGDDELLTDHTFISSTVFTPLEYGFVGLTEEDAIQKYGQSDVKVSHANYVPPGYCLTPRFQKCYGKIICVKSKDERVVGFHVCGPNAGEITQGFALALKLGARRVDFLNLMPVHPTSAEVFTKMHNSKTVHILNVATASKVANVSTAPTASKVANVSTAPTVSKVANASTAPTVSKVANVSTAPTAKSRKVKVSKTAKK